MERLFVHPLFKCTILFIVKKPINLLDKLIANGWTAPVRVFIHNWNQMQTRKTGVVE